MHFNESGVIVASGNGGTRADVAKKQLAMGFKSRLPVEQVNQPG
jgi:hypothetical protein